MRSNLTILLPLLFLKMENEKQAENFKIAISSTIKALAKKQDLSIVFSDAPAKESNVISLPKIAFDSIDEYQNIRALADSEALKMPSRLSSHREPGNTSARLAFVKPKLAARA